MIIERKIFNQSMLNLFTSVRLSLTEQCMPTLALHHYQYVFINPPVTASIKPHRRKWGKRLKIKLAAPKNYAIPFDSGVIVLTHWNENNYLQKDRYKGTIYLEEKNKLLCIQNVYTLDTQVRIGKVGKVGRLQEPKKNSDLDLIRDRFNFKK